MTDIVERLRRVGNVDNRQTVKDSLEAADEIERLRRIGTTEPCEKCNSPMMVCLQAKLAEARRAIFDYLPKNPDDDGLRERRLRNFLASDKGTDDRPCTCHPDDNPPKPCPRKYAYSECVEAAKAAESETVSGSVCPACGGTRKAVSKTGVFKCFNCGRPTESETDKPRPCHDPHCRLGGSHSGPCSISMP